MLSNRMLRNKARKATSTTSSLASSSSGQSSPRALESDVEESHRTEGETQARVMRSLWKLGRGIDSSLLSSNLSKKLAHC